MKQVFLFGAARSGTTLLRLMLNRHSAIFAPSEARFVSESYDLFHSAGHMEPDQVAGCISLIAASDSWKWWKVPDAELSRACRSLDRPTVVEVIEAILSHLAEAAGKSIWVEKTPHHCLYARRFATQFPNARLLHLVRDGRGACCSMVRRGWYDGQMDRVARYWEASVGHVGETLAAYPERSMEIRFEDLLRSPGDVLQRICEWLDVRFEPCMLRYQDQIEQHLGMTELHEKLLEPLDPAKITNWRRELSFKDLLVFDSLAGDLNSQNGYPTALGGCWRAVLAGIRLACNARRMIRRLAARVGPVRSQNG
jgi:hypothetical protein